MAEKDKHLEAGTLATPEQAAGSKVVVSRDQSPTGSTTTEVDYDKITIPVRQQHRRQQDLEKARIDEDDTDDTDHGEPDLEHEEAEEAVPGRDLDRQLSRVCLPRASTIPHSASPCEHRQGVIKLTPLVII